VKEVHPTGMQHQDVIQFVDAVRIVEPVISEKRPHMRSIFLFYTCVIVLVVGS
jgi:hypothetical protein